ncbi:MAG: MBL fold metallo-hydrolase [Anaerolineae bacterium]
MDLMSEIEPDIFQVRIPIPFPLKNIQSYLVREADGWTMIDTGLNDPPALEAWEHAFRALQMTPRDIRRILLTHTHPDHFGLAGYFQNLSSAPVYALNEEIEIVPREWPPKEIAIPMLSRYFARNGAPPDVMARVAGRSQEVWDMIQPLPVLSPLHEGDEVQIGGQPYRVIWVPGHADGHLIFHRVSDGLMFIGDHVLMKITPNIARWPQLDPNPLKTYLKSLDKVAPLHTSVALPGHRAVIHDLPGRIIEIKHHHDVRLKETWAAAGEGCDGYQVARVLFPRLITADDVRLGMVEALSHLEYLTQAGRLERLEDETTRYRQRN